MPPATPQPLPENAGLAFVGETLWPPAAVTTAQVRAIETARNPTGRPNSDVLRHIIGYKLGHAQEHRSIDFPDQSTAQEAALYQMPWQLLRTQLQDPAGRWWLNPFAQRELRTTLARLERYLATPLAAPDPAWDWIDSNRLPDDSLLVVARDDDFAQGLLSSRLFLLWWRQCSAKVSPPSRVASFPFPWPPATRLSSLSRTQEEQRLTLARAARGADLEQLNAAATAAYGWPAQLTGDEALDRLKALHQHRSAVGRDR
ncbi:MAG: hypothetical protein WCR49_12085 [Opitutae bacterium]